jgi:dynein intermediate chain 1, axonemal
MSTRNKFVYIERGVDTSAPSVYENVGYSTVKNKLKVHSDTIDAHTGTDLYLTTPAKATNSEANLYSDTFSIQANLMERIISMNSQYDIYHDYKYFEDPSDQFRKSSEDGQFGTLLPLWKFQLNEKQSRSLQVTCLSFNRKYSDLFAVGFGSYEYTKGDIGGVIAVYSLKNTTNPEMQIPTESGVVSLAWNPNKSGLLVVGLYDGKVQVYDIGSKKQIKKPLVFSSPLKQSHTDPVWEVKWQPETEPGHYEFISVSSDGEVYSWVIGKNDAEREELVRLVSVAVSVGAKTGSRENSRDDLFVGGGILESGLCCDFSPFNDDLFLIGTEEGVIHKCNKQLKNQFIMTYYTGKESQIENHSMAIYSVKWSPYNPDLFLAGSADWTVKLFDNSLCLLSFDLKQAVGDVAWAPFSSTVFAATTADGLIHCFDLNLNRQEPIAVQKIVKKSKLTKIVFSEVDPVILVGDERGSVNCLKLSPNLRIVTGKTKEEELAKMKLVLEQIEKP